MRIYHSGWHPDDIVSSDEKTLYDVAKFIQNFIIRTLFNAVVPRTNDSNTPLSNNLSSQGIRVTGNRISDDILTRVSGNQRRCFSDVMTSARRQDKT